MYNFGLASRPDADWEGMWLQGLAVALTLTYDLHCKGWSDLEILVKPPEEVRVRTYLATAFHWIGYMYNRRLHCCVREDSSIPSYDISFLIFW